MIDIVVLIVGIIVGFVAGFFFGKYRAYRSNDLSSQTSTISNFTTEIAEMKGKFSEIENSRTMLLLRFVTENLGCDVQWDGTTQSITITYQS